MSKDNEIVVLTSLLESYENAISANNIVSRCDLDGIITSVNDKFCEISGYSMDELLGAPLAIVKHPDMDNAVFEDMWATVRAKKTWTGTIKNKKKDGGHYYVDTSFSPILDENDNIVQFISIRHDITEIVEQRKELARNLNTDNLTGIGNRFKLLSDIERYNEPSLTLINIKNFREVNDFYGHEFGDLVIKEVAKRLVQKFKTFKHVNVYRVQGDEYAILNGSEDKPAFIALIYTLIDDVGMDYLSVLSEEVPVELTAALSFEKDKSILYTTADMAMHNAKREQKNFLIYNDELTLNKEYENNIKWTKELKNAIKEDRIVPFFQPIVNNMTAKFEKYECLVRMIGKDGKVISPYFFLDIAKRTETYLDITKIMIKKSFDQFKDSHAEFSINLNIQDITDNYLREFIIRNLEEYENGNQVVFEIVESEGIDNFDSVIEFIDIVKGYGCKIAIDDFGTGYSNFEYLLRLKADYIKIDASMIKNLDVSEDSRVIVSTIVDFAQKIGMKTIAEFVENELIESIVKEMGIDYCQGFYFGKPEEEPKYL